MPDGGTAPARSADARPVRRLPRNPIRLVLYRLDRLTLRRVAYSARDDLVLRAVLSPHRSAVATARDSPTRRRRSGWATRDAVPPF